MLIVDTLPVEIEGGGIAAVQVIGDYRAFILAQLLEFLQLETERIALLRRGKDHLIVQGADLAEGQPGIVLLRLQEENADNPSGSFFPPGCGDPQDYLDKYLNYQYPFFGFGIYLVLDKESQDPVGIAGYSFHEEVPGARLHRYVDGQLIPFHIEENDSVVEIGYCISRDRQGKGLASEILSSLISYGTDQFGFDRILAVTERTNTASIRLAEKNNLEIVFLP